jgi:hypothetical protein
LIGGKNAIGLQIEVAQSEGRILINQPVHHPSAAAPNDKYQQRDAKHYTSNQHAKARPSGAHLAGAQLHVEHILAAKTTVLLFAAKEHGGRKCGSYGNRSLLK